MERHPIVYENPEVDKLLDAGVRDADQEKRKEIHGKLQEVRADDLPCTQLREIERLDLCRKLSFSISARRT